MRLLIFLGALHVATPGCPCGEADVNSDGSCVPTFSLHGPMNASSPRAALPAFASSAWPTATVPGTSTTKPIAVVGGASVYASVFLLDTATAKLLACAPADYLSDFSASITVYAACPGGISADLDLSLVVAGVEGRAEPNDSPGTLACVTWTTANLLLSAGTYWIKIDSLPTGDDFTSVEFGWLLSYECQCGERGPYCDSLGDPSIGTTAVIPSAGGSVSSITSSAGTPHWMLPDAASSSGILIQTGVYSLSLLGAPSSVRINACVPGSNAPSVPPSVSLIRSDCWRDNMAASRLITLTPVGTSSDCAGRFEGVFASAWAFDVSGLTAGDYIIVFGLRSGETAYQFSVSVMCDCAHFGATCADSAFWSVLDVSGAVSALPMNTYDSTVAMSGVGPKSAGAWLPLFSPSSGTVPLSATLISACPNGGFTNSGTSLSMSAFATSTTATSSSALVGGCPNAAHPLSTFSTLSSRAPSAAVDGCSSIIVYASSRGDGQALPCSDLVVGSSGCANIIAAGAGFSAGAGAVLDIAAVFPEDGAFTLSATPACPCWTFGTTCSSGVPRYALSVTTTARWGLQIESDAVTLDPSAPINVWGVSQGGAVRPQAYWRVPSPAEIITASLNSRISTGAPQITKVTATTCTPTTITASRRTNAAVGVWLLSSCPAGNLNFADAAVVASPVFTLDGCSSATVSVSSVAQSSVTALYAVIDSSAVSAISATVRFSWTCGCGWGDWDCTSAVPATPPTRVDIFSGTGHGWASWDATVSPALNVIGGPGPDALVSLSFPTGLVKGSFVRLTTCPLYSSSAMLSTWPSANPAAPHALTLMSSSVLSSNSEGTCLAGGSTLNSGVIIGASTGPNALGDAYGGCTTLDLTEPPPGLQLAAVEVAMTPSQIDAKRREAPFSPGPRGPEFDTSSSGFIRMQTVCPCGTHGPSCMSLPAIPTLTARTGSVNGTLDSAAYTIIASSFEAVVGTPVKGVAGGLGSVGNASVRFLINIDAARALYEPVEATFSTCNTITQKGSNGKKGVAHTTLTLRSACAANAAVADAAFETAPTIPTSTWVANRWPDPITSGIGVASLRTLRQEVDDQNYEDGSSGCSTLSATLQPGATYLLSVDRAVFYSIGSRFQLDYALSYPSSTCDGDDLSGLSGNVTAVIKSAGSSSSAKSSSIFVLAVPASAPNNLTLTASTCGAATSASGGIGDTVITVYDSCADGSASALGSNDDVLAPYNTSLRCMQPGGTPHLGPSYAVVTSGFTPGAITTIVVSAGANARASSGAFTLEYALACPCASMGSMCENRIPSTALGGSSNKGSSIIQMSGFSGSAYATTASDVFIVISSPNSAPLPRALTVTTCASVSGVGATDTTLTALKQCPAGYREASSNILAYKDDDASSQCSTIVVAPASRTSWLVVESKVAAVSVPLTWSFECGCWASGTDCTTPIPRMPFGNSNFTGMSAMGLPVTKSMFGSSTMIESIFTWDHPGVLAGDPTNHIAQATFTANYLSQGAPTYSNGVTKCSLATAIYSYAGCLAEGMTSTLPGAPITTALPTFFGSAQSIGNNNNCPKLVLNAAALSVAAAARTVSFVVEPTSNGGTSKFSVSWELVCMAGWGGAGCATQISPPIRLETADGHYAGFFTTAFLPLPAGVSTNDVNWVRPWVNVVGGPAADALFTITVTSNTASMFFSTCTAHTINNKTGVGSTNIYMWDANTAPPIAGGIGLDASSGYNALVTVLGAGTPCSSIILAPSSARFGGSLGGSYIIVIEPSFPTSSGVVGVVFNRTCNAGYYGDECEKSLNVIPLSGTAGSITGEIYSNGTNLIGDSNAGAEAYFSFIPPPLPAGALASNFVLSLSTCNVNTADGLRDSIISVMSTDIGGGRPTAYVTLSDGSIARNDDTQECALAFIVTGMRSQLSVLSLPALVSGNLYTIIVSGYAASNYGAFTLDYAWTCACNQFGTTCGTSATSTSFGPFATGSGSVFLASPPNAVPASVSEALFKIDFAMPPGTISLKACGAGSSAPTITVNPKCWAGRDSSTPVTAKAAAGAGGISGCTQLSLQPANHEVVVAVGGASGTAGSAISVEWKAACPCHTMNNLTLGPQGSCAGKIDTPYIKYWETPYYYVMPPRYVSSGHMLGLGSSDSPSVFATFANPTTDAGQYRLSHLESVVLSTCSKFTTLPTRLWAFNRCVADGFSSVDEIGVLADSGLSDAPLALRTVMGTPSLSCSSITLDAAALADRDLKYFDIMAQARAGAPSKLDTVSFTLNYTCMCGTMSLGQKLNEPCVYRVADFITPVSWGPFESRWTATPDTSVSGIHLLDGAAMREAFSFDVGPGISRVNITTCDYDALQLPSHIPIASRPAQLTLLDASAAGAPAFDASEDARYHCLAGGVPTSSLPVIAESAPGGCATIVLDAASQSITGSYLLFASGAVARSNGWLQVSVSRTCRCGFNGPDCSPDSSTVFFSNVSALAGEIVTSTETMLPLFRGIDALGGSTSQAAMKITVPSGAVSLTAHTCTATTLDLIAGSGDTALALSRGDCIARGSAASDVIFLATSNNAGTLACPMNGAASLVSIASPAAGNYSLIVAALQFGNVGVSWAVRCACGMGGAECAKSLPSPTTVLAGSGGVIVVSIGGTAPVGAPADVMLGDFTGFPGTSTGPRAAAWYFSIPPIAGAALSNTALRISTCSSASLAPALIAVANAADARGCPASGARVETEAGKLGLALPPAPVSSTSNGCTELFISGSSMASNGVGALDALTLTVALPPSALAISSKAVLLEIDHDCSCGVFSSAPLVACDTAAAVISSLVVLTGANAVLDSTGLPTTLGASSTLAPVVTKSWWSSALGGVDGSGEVFYTVAVPLSVSGAVFSTCNYVTAGGLRDTVITISTRCPAGKKMSSRTSLDVLASSVSNSTVTGCSSVSLTSIGGRTLFAMVEATPSRAAALAAATSTAALAVRLDVIFTCLCGWRGVSCNVGPNAIALAAPAGQFSGVFAADAAAMPTSVIVETSLNRRTVLFTLKVDANTAFINVSTCTPQTRAGIGQTSGLVILSAAKVMADSSAGYCASDYVFGSRSGTAGVTLGTPSDDGRCQTAVVAAPSVGQLSIYVGIPSGTASSAFGLSFTSVCECGWGSWGTGGASVSAPGSCASPIATMNGADSGMSVSVDGGGSVTFSASEASLTSAPAPFLDIAFRASVMQLSLPSVDGVHPVFTSMRASTCGLRTTTGIEATSLYIAAGCVAGGRPLLTSALLVAGESVSKDANGGCSTLTPSLSSAVNSAAIDGALYLVVAAPPRSPMLTGPFQVSATLVAPSASPTPSAIPGVSASASASRTPARMVPSSTATATASSTPGSRLFVSVTLGGVPASGILAPALYTGATRAGVSFRVGLARAAGSLFNLASTTLQSVADVAAGGLDVSAASSSELASINAVTVGGSARRLRQRQLISSTNASTTMASLLAPAGMNKDALDQIATSIIATINSTASFSRVFPELVTTLLSSGFTITFVLASASIAVAPVSSGSGADTGTSSAAIIGGAAGGGAVFLLCVVAYYMLRTDRRGCPRICGRAGGFGVLPVAEEAAESVSGPLQIATKARKEKDAADAAAAKKKAPAKVDPKTKSASASWGLSGGTGLSGSALEQAKEKARLIAVEKKKDREKKSLLNRAQNQETRASVATGASTGLSITVDTDASTATPPRPAASQFARSAFHVESSSDEEGGGHLPLKNGENVWAKAIQRDDASDDDVADVSRGLFSDGRSGRRKSAVSAIPSPIETLHTSPLQIARAKARASAIDDPDKTVAVVGMTFDSPSERSGLQLRSPPPPSRPASAKPPSSGDFMFDDEGEDGDAAAPQRRPRPPSGAVRAAAHKSPTAALDSDLLAILAATPAPHAAGVSDAAVALALPAAHDESADMAHGPPAVDATAPFEAGNETAAAVVATLAEGPAHDFENWVAAPAAASTSSTDDWDALLAEAEMLTAAPPSAIAPNDAVAAAPAPPAADDDSFHVWDDEVRGRTTTEAEVEVLARSGASRVSAEDRLEEALAAVEAAAHAASNSPPNPTRPATPSSPSFSPPPVSAWLAEPSPMKQHISPLGRPVSALGESPAKGLSPLPRAITPLAQRGAAMGWHSLSPPPSRGGGGLDVLYPSSASAATVHGGSPTVDSSRLVAHSFVPGALDAPPPPPTALPAPSVRRGARPLGGFDLGGTPLSLSSPQQQRSSPVQQLGTLRIGPRHGSSPPGTGPTPPRPNAVLSAVSALAPSADLDLADAAEEKPPLQQNGWF